MWRWDQQEPFGVTAPDENPSALGVFEFPLRFPGQYADKETNLHYNYFRDYDSGIGRYVESDPLGLKGGLNTYWYVANYPLQLADPYGLSSETDTATRWLLRRTPGGAAQQAGEEAGKLCALNVPCGAGGQLANLINMQCQPLINVPGGTGKMMAPVAFNACLETCRKQWFQRCKPTSQCAEPPDV